MEVKPGFKQTDVGVIPDDWDVGSIGDLAIKVGSGITPTGGERVYKDDGRPFMRSQNVGWGALLLDDIAFIDEQTHASFSATEIKLNDVLLNITGASIGRSAVADAKIEGGNVNQHVCIIRVDTNKLSPHYVNLFLLSEMGQKQIDSFQAGGNRQGLNFGQIRSFWFPLPPLPEQRAIATALSDVDSLLSALDALLAKKRLIKQGAMQELLTGKKRLPGFDGEWKTVRFEDLCKTFTKQTGFDYSAYIKPSLIQEYRDGFFPFIQNKDFEGKKINYQTDYFVPEKVARNFPRILLDEKCLLISISGSIGNVAIFSNTQVAFVGGAIAVGKFNNESLLDWVMYYFQSYAGQNKLFGNVKAASHHNITLEDIRKIEIEIPSPKEHQQITDFLSDMDAEIAALAARREKTRLVKEGMMQELLTGRIRLI